MDTKYNVSKNKVKNKTTFRLFFLTCVFLLIPACATAPKEQGPQTIEIIEDYRVDSRVREDFNNAVNLLTQHEYEKAIILLNKITENTKNLTAPYINLGMAYIRIDKLEDAEESLTKALKLNPNHPLAKNEMAVVYRKTGRFSQARVLYEEVLSTYPDFLPARKNLGILCDLYLQDLKCANKHYEIYSASNQDQKNMRIWLADVKNRMK